MKPHHLLLAGGVLYLIAWFVPVHVALDHLPEAVPGAEAVRHALAPIWPVEGLDFEEEDLLALLFVVSAASNLLVLGLALALGSKSWDAIAVAGWACLAAALINTHWLLGLDDALDPADLRLGYYLWWLSFGLAGMGALQHAKELAVQNAEAPPTA